MRAIFTCTYLAVTSFCQLAHADNGSDCQNKWHAASYAKNSHLQEQQFNNFFALEKLSSAQSVLDVGSGDGKLTAKIAQSIPNAKVVGIDSSKQMVNFSKKTFPISIHPNLRFLHSSLEEFSTEEPFDYIVSFHTLPWIQDVPHALNKMHQLLSPSGKIFLLFVDKRKGFAFEKALKDTMKDYQDFFTDYQDPMQSINIETCRKSLQQAGFHIKRIEYVYTPTTFASKKAFKGWISQWLTQAKYLEPLEKAAFLNELVKNYLLELHQPDKTSPIHWGEYIFIVEACKGL